MSFSFLFLSSIICRLKLYDTIITSQIEHWVNFFGSWIKVMCFSRVHFNLNFLSHIIHWYFLFSSWTDIMWLFKWVVLLNLDSNSENWCGLSFSWTDETCFFNAPFTVKYFSQREHLNGFIFSWTLDIWLFRWAKLCHKTHTWIFALMNWCNVHCQTVLFWTYVLSPLN